MSVDAARDHLDFTIYAHRAPVQLKKVDKKDQIIISNTIRETKSIGPENLIPDYQKNCRPKVVANFFQEEHVTNFKFPPLYSEKMLKSFLKKRKPYQISIKKASTSDNRLDQYEKDPKYKKDDFKDLKREPDQFENAIVQPQLLKDLPTCIQNMVESAKTNSLEQNTEYQHLKDLYKRTKKRKPIDGYTSVYSKKVLSQKLKNIFVPFFEKQLMFGKEYEKVRDEAKKSLDDKLAQVFRSNEKSITKSSELRKKVAGMKRSFIFKNIITQLLKNILPIIFGIITLINMLKGGFSSVFSKIMLLVSLVSALVPIFSVIQSIRKWKAYKEGFDEAFYNFITQNKIAKNEKVIKPKIHETKDVLL